MESPKVQKVSHWLSIPLPPFFRESGKTWIYWQWRYVMVVQFSMGIFTRFQGCVSLTSKRATSRPGSRGAWMLAKNGKGIWMDLDDWVDVGQRNGRSMGNFWKFLVLPFVTYLGVLFVTFSRVKTWPPFGVSKGHLEEAGYNVLYLNIIRYPDIPNKVWRVFIITIGSLDELPINDGKKQFTNDPSTVDEICAGRTVVLIYAHFTCKFKHV